MSFSLRVALLVAASAVISCSASDRYEVVAGPRDWAKSPAVVEIEAGPALYAVSDIHGGFDRMVALFAAHGLVEAAPASPGAIRWTGGDAVLVVVGDMIDKGPNGFVVLEALMALEKDATSNGGRVVVLVGNHEAEFFVDPYNDKASEFDLELVRTPVAPLQIADGSHPVGKWLRDRPFAARVGDWFFAHAGDTGGRSIAELGDALRAAIEAHDYDDPELTGSSSLLESRDWFAGDPEKGRRYAEAAGAKHVVFGHSPHSLGPDGRIAVGQEGALFRIDCGMSPAVDYSAGVLLRVEPHDGGDVVQALAADGSVEELGTF